MTDTLIVLETYYNIPLVLFSILMAVIGSFVALEINTRITQLPAGRRKMPWILAGAGTMGIAIWSMHFIGMSAFQLYVPLQYDWLMTVFSIIPAIISAFLAFFVLHHMTVRWSTVLTAGLLMGGGISAMHYTGMQAISFAGVMTHTPASIITATSIAVIVSFAALAIFTHSRTIQSMPLRGVMAVVMGLAISSMHYTGMGGSSFCLPPEMSNLIQAEPTEQNNVLGVTTILATIVMYTAVQFILQSENRWAQRMSFIDPATELPNRRSFEALSVEELRRYPAVMFAEINNFSMMNDSYGLETSDQILFIISGQLSKRLPEGAKLYKLNGSRFAALLTEESEAGVLERMRDAAEEYIVPVFGSDQEIDVQMTAGAALTYDITSHRQLAREIDAAMREARYTSTRCVLYDQNQHDTFREQELAEDLRRAIAEQKLDVYYQPKVDSQSLHADKVEALVRWNHPQHGFISPGLFIPAAERYGLIMPLTETMLRMVCRDLESGALARRGIKGAAVNLSPAHFQVSEANSRILAIVQEFNIQAEDLEFEVTESTMMESVDRAVQILYELRAAGHTIALDDFGTGLSSMTYLQKLPADTLKIDKSFIQSMTDACRNEAVVKLMIDFARTANMDIVCEGVETKAQLERIQHLSHAQIQGFYFQRPVPLEQIQTDFSERARKEA
ncbi:putative bifunctional diguanylate cyclase/phosphodiesterase [Alkalicoccus chagannorensis]|uniref:putative bifunctional diguanylate cyclase/phosphodiesterase n=1 Tax=Alkalicoccus chagannorensis TaxID=427072 RepID=UPI0003F65961|nr:EAL domain-containing protein [Alkalicoccus chagannorensis]